MKKHRKRRPSAPSRSLASVLRALPSADASAASERESSVAGFFTQALMAPDGTCVLAAKEGDSVLRVFEGEREALWARETSAAIYGAAWFPLMQSSKPETCAFAAMSKNTPVHLWDAFAPNYVRASYSPVDAGGEVALGLISLALSDSAVFAGGRKGAVYAWDIARPGAPLQRLRVAGAGTLSSLDATNAGVLAVGGFDNSAALVDLNSGAVCWEAASAPSVTRVRLKGSVLWVGGRRADAVAGYDIRAAQREPLHVVPRASPTNQRIDFDVRNGYLVTGSHGDGVRLWDVRGAQPASCAHLALSGQTANAVSFDPTRSFDHRITVATGTRPRAFKDSDDDGDDGGSSACASSAALDVWTIKVC